MLNRPDGKHATTGMSTAQIHKAMLAVDTSAGFGLD